MNTVLMGTGILLRAGMWQDGGWKGRAPILLPRLLPPLWNYITAEAV